MSAPEDERQPDKVEELKKEVESLQRRLERAFAEIERLRKELEDARRAAKRQAAPFSKGEPNAEPKLPGRKRGAEYGQRASRPVPARVDRVIPVPLPKKCLRCGGPVVYKDTKPQFQEDIVRLSIVRQFDVEIGHCGCCGTRVQGRHPLQTSDALGAAQVQVGPEALSLAAHLNKEMGLSHERVARVLDLGYGLQASRSALCRALKRLGKKAAPTYEQLRITVRSSPLTWMDETGWRVAAHLEWLWVAVSPQVTVYDILPGRGFPEAASILGEDYAGVLHHDGWRPYYSFLKAFHQSCLSHLIDRCRDIIQIAAPTARRFPQAVLQLFQKALVLRDRFRSGEVSIHGLYVATGRIDASMDRLLDKSFRSKLNRRFAKHLRHERPYLFSFLYCPDLDATNNAAERAIRPVVIARKTWGGNRSTQGAETQKILASVLRTCCQQGKESFARLTELMCSRTPIVLDIVPAALSP